MNSAVRRACAETWAFVCLQVYQILIHLFIGIWLTASIIFIPIGCGIYATKDEHIGIILMSSGAACLTTTILYYVFVFKFCKFYRREKVRQQEGERHARQTMDMLDAEAIQELDKYMYNRMATRETRVQPCETVAVPMPPTS